SGLSTLTLAYRDREEMREKRKRPSRARIGYYFFGVLALFMLSFIVVSHVALLFLKTPTVDITVVFLRLLFVTCIIPCLCGLWLIYKHFMSNRGGNSALTGRINYASTEITENQETFV
ncbi:hypothetical protein BV898_14440, partial [Hypsibius exemplaris]